ncbi:fatty acid CoA ligase FadD9 [Amycolatopsis arida]|uniref:Carboxylic acid reductase n=1 Tax=Amycolatopsis arida TaxID=587909 RepID=A0A1I5LZY6_9PSEU|nr:carboxylic acid reductase [Amycolatopsis arida]TDX93915.1 fatty acid CoA ligase FadD9 [Amycolatopsis arida]SFP02899.1 fatty acid CoA ligase FadD9 [Amycolatopsis arida]
MVESPFTDNAAGEEEARRIAELCDHDPQVRAATPLPSITAAIQEPGTRLASAVATVMTGYADRPALGRRARELVRDPRTGRTTTRLLPRFETLSYAELWANVRAVAGAWHHDPDAPLAAGDTVATLGFTSADHVTLDLACVHLGAVAVPLQSSAPAGQLAPIVAETAPRILATSVEQLDTAVEIASASPALRRVVVFDYAPEVDDQREAFDAARRRLAGGPVVVESLADVLDRGRRLPEAPLSTEGDGDRLALLIYTSGSTGTPKGAMYPERLVHQLWVSGFSPDGWAEPPTIGVSYLPLSHIAGRMTVTAALARGGTTYFTARSDQSTLFEDIAMVRPTDLMLIPRVCDLLYERFLSDPGWAGATDRAATEARLAAAYRREALGGRVIRATCGSAPLSPEVAAFVESVLGLPLHDGYGSTEAGPVLVDTRVLRPPVLDYKLVDVPELGYRTSDSPHPRGELLVRTERVIPGYYRRPDLDAEIFTEDGYYRTGDIMAELGPDRLAYVDRRKNVLKLAQGEFVAVARLEAIFAASPLIHQIFVHGNSTRSFLLAVIVPSREAISRAEASGTDLAALLQAELRRVAQDAELHPYEIPRDFLIETEPFSEENGLLTDSRKLQRPRLRERYGERLEQRYAELAEGNRSELGELRRTARELPVLDAVLRAARVLLGGSGAEPSPEARFTDLGGDSLSALSMANLLREILDVEVPVGVIVSPATDLRALAGYVERERGSGTRRPTVATVHGPGSAEVLASDLTLEKFLDADTLAAATALPRPSGPVRTVLLTGANGYLGRFLCLEWLERVAPRGGTVIGIVRGGDAAAARERMEAAFDTGDPELLRRFRELAGHLEVLPGDIGEPSLGLDERTWRRLADSVDLVVHQAALVNHVLPYDQLFGPNVAGTAELIRLALTTRLKPVTYLSTVGVAAQVGPAALDEDADIRVTSPRRRLDESYANGYATSKWAGEVLLREAHDRFGLPVAVFRSDMILAHGRYAGQLNGTDMFTRLLLSLATTGIAPASFYRGAGEGRPRAHYDGLPVDFTAEAITTLGEQATEGFATFNVVNPHDDGVSLDVIVDWLAGAGCPIERIDDYAEWFARFETAVRALPEDRRRHSMLPLLHAVRHPEEPVRGSAVPARRFSDAVRAAKIGPGGDVPHLSAELVGKYVADLRRLGLLPA